MSDQREQAIRERAYAIWELEGRPIDRSLPRWLQAEAEVGTERIVGHTDEGRLVLRANGSDGKPTKSSRPRRKG